MNTSSIPIEATNYIPSYQPFGGRYFASRSPLAENDTLGNGAEVYAQKDMITGPMPTYSGQAFGLKLSAEAANRMKSLIVEAVQMKRPNLSEEAIMEAIIGARAQ